MAAQYAFSSDMTLHENMVCRGLCVSDQDVCGYIYDGKVNPVIDEKAMTCVVNPTAREKFRRLHAINLPDCQMYIAHRKRIEKACKGLLPKGRGSHKAWCDVATAAVEKCRDFTGQSLVVLEKHPKSKDDISGSKTRVLFAMAQITDKDTIADLKKCHADLHELKFGMSKETQRMNGDHSTHMTGKPFIQTNKSAMTYGYATYLQDGFGPQLTEGRVHAAIEALAAMVWRLAVERFPFLQRFREQALGQLVRQLAVLGATATNVIAGSTNAPICLHFDKEDGPMSIILWLHSGLKGEKGGILDGHFVVPGIYVRLVPTDVTIVVISTADLLHGTFQLQVWGGAIRYGTSHFLRVKDARMVVSLERGVGHVQEEVVRRVAADVRDGRLAPEQAVTQTLEAGPTPEPMTPLLSGKLQTIYYHNMHCNTLTKDQRDNLGSYFLDLRKCVMERGAETWDRKVVDKAKLTRLQWQTYDAPARGKRSPEGLNRKHAKRQQQAAEGAAAAAAGSAAKQSK